MYYIQQIIRHIHASIKGIFHILTQQNHDALNNFPTEWTRLVTTEFNEGEIQQKRNTVICPVTDCGKHGYKIHIVCHLCIFASFALWDFWTYSSVLLFCLPTPPTIYIVEWFC